MPIGQMGTTQFGRTSNLDTDNIPSDIWDIAKPYIYLEKEEQLYVTITSNDCDISCGFGITYKNGHII